MDELTERAEARQRTGHPDALGPSRSKAKPATDDQHRQIDALLFLIEREAAYPADLTRGQARTIIAGLRARARELGLDPNDAQPTPR